MVSQIDRPTLALQMRIFNGPLRVTEKRMADSHRRHPHLSIRFTSVEDLHPLHPRQRLHPRRLRLTLNERDHLTLNVSR
jgi:hypothetical protein